MKKKKIIKQLKYLYHLSNKFLILLFKELNKIHRVNYSKRFWKIMLIHWLNYYSNFYFKIYLDAKKKNFRNTTDLDNYYINDTFHSTESIHNLIYSKAYYQKIFQSIVKKKRIILSKPIEKKDIFEDKIYCKNYYLNSLINEKKNKILVLITQLGTVRELIINFKFFQFPKFKNVLFKKKNLFFSEKKYNFLLRNKLKKIFKSKNKFEKKLFYSICEELPKCILENFNELESLVEKINLPKNPKIILSSYALSPMCLYNFYLAKKLEGKTKLIYYQHGGSYGVSQNHYQEKIEIDLSDKFLSWGWKKKNKKVFKIGAPYIKKKFKLRENKKILLILKSLKLGNKGINVGSSIEPINNYFYRQKKLLVNLKKLDVNYSFPSQHPMTNEVKNFNYEYILKHFRPSKKGKFFQKIKNYNLILNTDVSTPHLETMFYKIPNILIIPKLYNDFDFFSKNYFSSLEKNKLLFFSEKKAAKFINKLINDDLINVWWNSGQVQNTVLKFNENFAKFNPNIVDDIIKNF